jgi:pilus assembly protein Flp/PilA
VHRFGRFYSGSSVQQGSIEGSRNVSIQYRHCARRAIEWMRDESGVTAIEYGLLAALIAVVCVVAFQATGLSLGDVYTAWSSAVIAAL